MADSGFQGLFDPTRMGQRPGLTVGKQRSQQGPLFLHRKIGVWPLAFAWRLQGVRPLAILGLNQLPDGKDGQAET